MLFHTNYSEYFKENVHLFNALEFMRQGLPTELTQHVPPKGLQLIRRYGLYSSRIRGRWEQLGHISCRAPAGWRQQHGQGTNVEDDRGFVPLSETVEVDSTEYKQAWARLLAKVYEVDPFVCPVCGSEMKVIAVIQNPEEIKKILAHLVKVGRAPPGFDPAELN